LENINVRVDQEKNVEEHGHQLLLLKVNGRSAHDVSQKQNLGMLSVNYRELDAVE
jgi:hypothetical protein